jgi:hypothetical protein
VTGNLGYSGSLSKLDVAENGSATVRAADFNFGHSTRHGKTGRAFVDSGDTLVINWAGDWPKATIGSGLTVGGDLQVSGARIRNSSGLGLLEANANDLLRINPDGAFPAIAVYKPMSLVTGGLVVGSLATAAQGELVVTGNVRVGGDLQVNGARIRNSSGLGLLEANATDWLRINPDGAFPGIAVYKPMSLGTGGLVVGNWEKAKQGELVVTMSATIGNGLNSVDALTIRFPQGRWVFQADGNLVKYNNANTPLWALNNFNGNHAGW